MMLREMALEAEEIAALTGGYDESRAKRPLFSRQQEPGSAMDLSVMSKEDAVKRLRSVFGRQGSQFAEE